MDITSSPPLPLNQQHTTEAPAAAASDEDKLKASLWHAVGRQTDAITLSQLRTNATPQFIGSLTELLWSQIESAAVDIETFARHADRTVVTAKDVLLLARQNEGLRGVLQRELEAVREAAPEKKRGGR